MAAGDIYSGVAIASLGEALRTKASNERQRVLAENQEILDQGWKDYVARKKREAAEAFASDDARDQVVATMLDEIEQAAADGHIDPNELRLSRRANRDLRVEMHRFSQRVKLIQRLKNQGLEPSMDELREAAQAEEELARIRSELKLPPKP